MSSVEDFLHDQQFEGLDELDADAEDALLADNDNDEGSEKNTYEEVEYVDYEGNPVEIGENEEVEVFDITEGHDGYQHEDGEQGFDDVLDLEVDDDLEFQTTQDIGTPGVSNAIGRPEDVRRVTATTYGGAASVKTPNAVGSAQDEDKSRVDVELREEENESRLLSDSEEEDEDDDGARGRFKSERANIVSLTRVKQRVIPDSLDAIVVNTDVGKGHPGRGADQRKPNQHGQNRNSRERNSAQWTHGGQGPNAGNALLPAPIPLLSLPFQQPHKGLNRERGGPYQSGVVKELVGHQQGKEQWANQQGGDGGHGSRKILINPHFKGGSPTHKGTNSSHRVLQTVTDKPPKYDGNRTAHSEYVQQPVLPVQVQVPAQQPGPQLGHHLRYSAPFGQPPPPVRPPENNQNVAQIHQTFVQHRFPPPDPQAQIQHPNPAAGHPLLLHPSANQPPPNFQCSQFTLPPPQQQQPPHQMRTAVNPTGGFNPTPNNYSAQGSVLGNYPGANTVGQMYPSRRLPNDPQQQQQPQPQHHPPPPPPQYNHQYQQWNHEEPWRYPAAQGPNPMVPQTVQQHLPLHPPHHPPPPSTRWRHPQMQGPSLITPMNVPRPPQHQMQMHGSIAPRPRHPNFSTPPPQGPIVQRHVYRAPGPPLPQHTANLMVQYRAAQSIQNVRPQQFRRQDTLSMNPQGTGPVLRLISPVPMHEMQRKQQHSFQTRQLGQQQQEQMQRKRPGLDVTSTPPKTARGPGGLPLKVVKVPNPLLNKPQAVKSRVGVPRPGTLMASQPVTLEREPAAASAGATGNNEVEEEEDEEMKAYRAKIEMQKRKREEILRIKELRRQKMAEMRRRELLHPVEALPVMEVPPLTNQDPTVPTVTSSPIAVATAKKRVYLVRKVSTSGVVPSTADGPLQNVANRPLIGNNVTNLGNKESVLLRKQVVQSRITPRPNPNLNLNRTQPSFPGQTNRIVTFQNNANADLANALPNPSADTAPKRNFQVIQPQVITTVPKKTTVLVENLAQATTDAHLRKLCSTIGPVESVRLDKAQRVAQIVFPNVSDAETFISKFQRRMVDLSVINISML